MGDVHEVKPSLNVLLPVLNEEDGLRFGVESAQDHLMKSCCGNWIITIVDNGSSDGTISIAEKLCEEDDHIRLLKCPKKGVGAAFRYGVQHNGCDIVGYMDVDLATDLSHLDEMYDAFCTDSSLGIVNASRFASTSSVAGRKWYRNITSAGLVGIMRSTFKIQATDVICGFKFFRKKIAEQLLAEAYPEDGWFQLIELIVLAEKNNIPMLELPVVWNDDPNSKVKVVKLTISYLQSIKRLKGDLRSKGLL